MINLTTKLVIHNVEVGIYPTSIAVDPGTHRVYVANAGTTDRGESIGNTVSVIDTANNFATSSVTVPGFPQAVAVDPATHLAYVVHHAADLGTFDGVSVLDPSSLTFGETIRVGAVPQGIAIAAGRAYVPVRFFGTTASGGALAAIDLTTKAVTYTPVGSDPFGVAVDPTTDRAYVTQGARNANGIDVDFGVAVVNTTTNKSLGTILTGGSFPILVAVDSGTHTAYATNADGTVAVIDTTTSQLAGTVTVGGHPTGVAVDRTAQKAYVANGPGVVVLERNGNTATTTPSVGAINPIVSTDGFSLLFATVAPGTAGGNVVFSDGASVIDRCGSRPIVFGYALCFTTFTTGGDHTITANYVGDNTHAPSSVSAPVTVNAQPDPFQTFLGQFLRVARVILGGLVPAENLDFFF